jgi:hypothetical protein
MTTVADFIEALAEGSATEGVDPLLDDIFSLSKRLGVLHAANTLIETVRAWANADCSNAGSDAVLAALANYDNECAK